MSVDFEVVERFRGKYKFLPVEDMPSNMCWVVSRLNSDMYERICTKPSFARLARTLAVEHPTWAFYGRGLHNAVDTFEIYCGEENIGKVSYIAGKYNVYSPAIARDMLRKDHKTVKSEAAAYKLAKTIMPKSIEEHLQGTCTSIQSALHSLVSDHKYAAKCAVDKLFYVFDQFVRNSPDEAKRIFAESGADVELVDKALEKIGVHEATVKLRDATLNEYIDVLLRDGMYITTIPYRVEDGKLVAPIKTYGVTKDSDALSPTQKRHLGLLKLTENGTFIPNVGFRFSDNEFRIFV